MSKYRTYKDEEEDEADFIVFIIHGHSDDWRKVERYINHNLNFRTVVLLEDNNPSNTIIEDLEENINEMCDCAVAIMSPDDITADGKNRARQNVLFEIGYCFGFYNREDVVILKEKSVEINSDLHGLIYIPYLKDNIDTTFHKLGERLEEIFESYENEEE